MRRFISYAGVCILLLGYATDTLAQSNGSQKAKPQKQQLSTQTALTGDGKRVLLKSDGTWEYTGDAGNTPHAESTSTLGIEVGVVFRSGDVKPIARATLYLLDEDLLRVLKEAQLEDFLRRLKQDRNGLPIPSTGRTPTIGDSDYLQAFVLAPKYANFGVPEMDSLWRPFYQGAMSAIKPHIVQTIVTDLAGKAVFLAVKSGTYYVFSLAPAGKTQVLWNMRVDLKPGDSSVILSNDNAAYSY